MGRQKKNELALEVRERNGQFYAYESTSKWDPEKKKKVTETTYKGKWDPVTETVMPKKARGKYRSKEEREEAWKEMTIKEMVDGLWTKEYGSVYLLDVVQHRSRLGRDLWVSFGEAGRAILGAAMALCVHRGSFMSIEDTMERSMIPEMYALKSAYSSQEMSEFTHLIGMRLDCIDTFFGLRFRDNEGIAAWDSTTEGTYAKDNGLSDYVGSNKDNEDIPQIKKAIASNRRGIPMMYELYPGTMSDQGTLVRFVERARRYGAKDVTYVMDRGYVSGANIHYMNSIGARFVFPAKIRGKVLSSLLTGFKKPVRKRMMFDNHAYDVWETELWLKEADRKLVDGREAWDLFHAPKPDKDGNYPEPPEGVEAVKAFVVYDTKKGSDEIQSLRLLINDISARLDRVDSPEPMKEFKEIVGRSRKLFAAKADGRRLEYRVKKNAQSFRENRAGTYIMLATDGMSWEEMMASYDARRLVEQCFDRDKTDWGRFGTSDPVTIQGREFVRFVSLILECELGDMLRKAGRTDAYDTVLNTMAAIAAMGKGDQWFVKCMCKKHRDLLADLKIEEPSEIHIGLPIFTQQEADELEQDTAE